MFDQLRERYFPPERNFLAAHVTIFHHLPGDERHAVTVGLAEVALDRKPFAVRVEGLFSLGRGTAYRLVSPELATLRAQLATEWNRWLMPQDRQKFQPHVTVQNKVEPAQARALLDHLKAGFQPWDAQAEGLDLWEYRGGPWEFLEGFAFAGSGDAGTYAEGGPFENRS